jgi:glycine cleavage system protein P-like pyridoxal-binding family
MDDGVAALMVTNPNTLGLFEEELQAVAEVVRARGGLVYMDGANMNALMGVAKAGDMGVDVMQFNLHKTFSTPHGGGGPGAGPIAVRSSLAEYLPVRASCDAAASSPGTTRCRRASVGSDRSTGTSASWCARWPTSCAWAARGSRKSRGWRS